MPDTIFSTLHSIRSGLSILPEQIRNAAASIKHQFSDIEFGYCVDYPENLYYKRAVINSWSRLLPHDYRHYLTSPNRDFDFKITILTKEQTL